MCYEGAGKSLGHCLEEELRLRPLSSDLLEGRTGPHGAFPVLCRPPSIHPRLPLGCWQAGCCGNLHSGSPQALQSPG